MSKSPDAFRTISEVAEYLQTPAHVLRFWETKFSQIRPVKRAGGRRYYRPTDVALLISIKRLLHDDGFTIRGVQKMLREQGVREIAGQSYHLAESFAQAEPLNIFTDDPAVDDGSAPRDETLVEEDVAPCPADGYEDHIEAPPAVRADALPAADASTTAEPASLSDPHSFDGHDHVPEAPMAIWVDEDEPEAPVLSASSVISFPAAADLAASEQKNNDSMTSDLVMILDDSAQAPIEVITSARQMAQLRALRPESLSHASREELGCLRDLAQDLLGRLAS